MNTEKLAYQYGLDLAAAERGYSSFEAFQKTAAPAWQRFLAEGGEDASRHLLRGGTGMPAALINAAEHHPQLSMAGREALKGTDYAARSNAYKEMLPLHTPRQQLRFFDENTHTPTWAMRDRGAPSLREIGRGETGPTGRSAFHSTGSNSMHESFPLAQGYGPLDKRYGDSRKVIRSNYELPNPNYSSAEYLSHPVPGI